MALPRPRSVRLPSNPIACKLLDSIDGCLAVDLRKRPPSQHAASRNKATTVPHQKIYLPVPQQRKPSWAYGKNHRGGWKGWIVGRVIFREAKLFHCLWMDTRVPIDTLRTWGGPLKEAIQKIHHGAGAMGSIGPISSCLSKQTVWMCFRPFVLLLLSK